MPVKEILEDRELRVRNMPDELHEKLEAYIRNAKKKERRLLNKQTATMEILSKALSKIKTD